VSKLHLFDFINFLNSVCCRGYKAPGAMGHDSGRDSCVFKVNGTKIHGHKGKSLFIVDVVLSDLVINGTNLMCTLVYRALLQWQNRQNRNDSSLPPYV